MERLKSKNIEKHFFFFKTLQFRCLSNFTQRKSNSHVNIRKNIDNQENHSFIKVTLLAREVI